MWLAAKAVAAGKTAGRKVVRVRLPPRPPRAPTAAPTDVRAERYSRIATESKRGRCAVQDTRRWRYSPDQLARAVRTSCSYRQVLAKLGLSTQGGGAYSTLHRRIELLALDTTHFVGQGWNLCNVGGKLRSGAIPLDTLLTEDSPCTNFGRLKRRLIAGGFLENRCSICDLEPVWNGSELVLRLDHINGNRRDNRIENLRMVCPNCDSQLPTFAGRNKGRASVATGASA